MQFDPNNTVVKLCLQGMDLEAKDQPENASVIFIRAWNVATNDFEKFIAAYYVARHQKKVHDKLKWLETTLELAQKVNDPAVNAAVPILHSSIAECYNDKGDTDNSKKHQALAESISNNPTDKGPFYHGTKANLQTGDLLKAGSVSNYDSNITMNHIYFTALVNGAGLAAALAKGNGAEHVYLVEPSGSFENDPNVTNKKFPGNPTRSYRSKEPLKVIGEITDWKRISAAELQKWKEKLANIKGEIIN